MSRGRRSPVRPCEFHQLVETHMPSSLRHPFMHGLRLGALVAACTFATHDAAAGEAGDVRFSRTAMVVEHVTATSAKPYAAVKKDLETRLGRLDDSIRAELKA